jgi:hypothetical protein
MGAVDVTHGHEVDVLAAAVLAAAAPWLTAAVAGSAISAATPAAAAIRQPADLRPCCRCRLRYRL